MAKISAGHTKIHGKMGGMVYVQNSPYGAYVRTAAKEGSRKDEPAFLQQHSRTAYLNRLAGAVNNAMNQLAGPLKSGRFYENVQKLFRKEPENNRLLLLRRLVGMEANPRYVFCHHAAPELRISLADNTINVSVMARQHPEYGKKVDANCYTYELALTTWPEDDAPPNTQLLGGSWLPLKGPGAMFEFNFALPAGARHWMLCIRLCSGTNNEPTKLFTTDGALIYQIGSTDPAEQAWLQALPTIRDEIKHEPKEEPAPVPRVAAKPLPEAR